MAVKGLATSGHIDEFVASNSGTGAAVVAMIVDWDQVVGGQEDSGTDCEVDGAGDKDVMEQKMGSRTAGALQGDTTGWRKPGGFATSFSIGTGRPSLQLHNRYHFDS